MCFEIRQEIDVSQESASISSFTPCSYLKCHKLRGAFSFCIVFSGNLNHRQGMKSMPNSGLFLNPGLCVPRHDSFLGGEYMVAVLAKRIFLVDLTGVPRS